nr:unnamed protein product [Callosobruchus analis]
MILISELETEAKTTLDRWRENKNKTSSCSN